MFSYIKNTIRSKFKPKKSLENIDVLIKEVMAELQPDRGLFKPNELLILVTVRMVCSEYGSEHWRIPNLDLLNLCISVHDSFSIAETERQDRLSEESMLTLFVYFCTFYLMVIDSPITVRDELLKDHIEHETRRYIPSGISAYPKVNLPADYEHIEIRKVLSSIIR